jgi:nucleoside-diphosphate-sugar epimerase
VVYGVDHPRGTVLDEGVPLRSGGQFASYQASKVAAEQRARQRADELGVELVVIRPGVLYGPGRPIRTGLLSLGRYRIAIGSSGNHMPFTYVGNVVDALLLAATTPAAAGEAFNIVDGPDVRACDALGLVEPDARVVPVPVPVAMTAARLLEARHRRAGLNAPKLSRFAVRSASRDVVYDTAKAKRILGWAPRVSLGEGVGLSARKADR